MAENIFDKSDNFLIFKHSTACPVSAAAYDEVQAYRNETNALPIVTLIVQEEPELKLEVAQRYGVQHKSPQILFIQNQKCADDFSHHEITKDRLLKLGA